MDNILFSHLGYFDLIISSSDIGLAKPDKRIYGYLIDRLGVKPEEIIFIDNRKENLLPANSLGIKTFHFTNKDELEIWLKQEKLL